jgi:hypothetical protein
MRDCDPLATTQTRIAARTLRIFRARQRLPKQS